MRKSKIQSATYSINKKERYIVCCVTYKSGLYRTYKVSHLPILPTTVYDFFRKGKTVNHFVSGDTEYYMVVERE